MKTKEDLAADIMSYMMMQTKLGEPIKDKEILFLIGVFEAEKLKDQVKICGKFHETATDEFEDAIKKFGVDTALEYFATPEERYREFDFLKRKTKELKTSNIDKIEWDETNLWVYFNNGGIYQYLDIPEKISVELGNAESPGSYMHQEIKGTYRYTRIE